MVALKSGGFFRYDPERPALPNNDRLTFSKGHALPLLYALWAVAGRIPEEELMTYRVFGSRLEGHPIAPGEEKVINFGERYRISIYGKGRPRGSSTSSAKDRDVVLFQQGVEAGPG